MSARVLVLDLERIPAWTKPLPVWDMKGLQNKYLSPDDIETWGRTICLASQWWGGPWPGRLPPRRQGAAGGV